MDLNMSSSILSSQCLNCTILSKRFGHTPVNSVLLSEVTPQKRPFMEKTRRTYNLMLSRDTEPCACMMRAWRLYNLMLSRGSWPFGNELVRCIRDENVAYAQYQSVKLLVGPVRFLNRKRFVSDQQLHAVHSTSRLFVTTPRKRSSFESSPQF